VKKKVKLALLSLLACALPAAAAAPEALLIWPGYRLELPPGYCVGLSKGADFDVYTVRSASGAPVLASIYAGYAPNFQPDCEKPTKRSWNANGLSFDSVRGADGCAEFLVHDATNSERGQLHIWFGPAAKEHAQLAERLVESVRPARMPVNDATEPPQCH
jgi:hypothetical protein